MPDACVNLFTACHHVLLTCRAIAEVEELLAAAGSKPVEQRKQKRSARGQQAQAQQPEPPAGPRTRRGGGGQQAPAAELPPQPPQQQPQRQQQLEADMAVVMGAADPTPKLCGAASFKKAGDKPHKFAGLATSGCVLSVCQHLVITGVLNMTRGETYSLIYAMLVLNSIPRRRAVAVYGDLMCKWGTFCKAAARRTQLVPQATLLDVPRPTPQQLGGMSFMVSGVPVMTHSWPCRVSCCWHRVAAYASVWLAGCCTFVFAATALVGMHMTLCGILPGRRCIVPCRCSTVQRGLPVLALTMARQVSWSTPTCPALATA
jgi:hypothetical protein